MVSPFLKQCFVTLGVAMNMAQFGLIQGFTAILLPQLKVPDSSIQIDDNSGSWIAAIPGFALIVGNFIVPSIMGIYGRKIAHVISIIAMTVGWIFIATANSLLPIFFARILQGISLGISTSLGPILIAEYTSPKNRGAFLSSESFIMAIETLAVHTVGSYVTWQKTSCLCTVFSFINFLIIIASPESPSWLAAKGRVEDCQKTFHWLRGHHENEELNKMIAAYSDHEIVSNIRNKNSLRNFRNTLVNLKRTLLEKEFYKPIFFMVHVYILGEWAGINILSPFIHDVIEDVVGTENINVALLIITVDSQRIIMTIVAIYMIKKFKRRTMIISTTAMCIVVQLATAGYSYARITNILPFDSPIIGIILIHLHMFTIATGSVPLPVIISGEIFPLKYRSISGAISALFLSLNFFITVKTFPYLYKNLRLYGTYLLYTGIITYCLVVIWLFLPETKDKTLQEIEEEFRGHPVKREDVLSAEALVRE